MKNNILKNTKVQKSIYFNKMKEYSVCCLLYNTKHFKIIFFVFFDEDENNLARLIFTNTFLSY